VQMVELIIILFGAHPLWTFGRPLPTDEMAAPRVQIPLAAAVATSHDQARYVFP
jgi:hypothetical protein